MGGSHPLVLKVRVPVLGRRRQVGGQVRGGRIRATRDLGRGQREMSAVMSPRGRMIEAVKVTAFANGDASGLSPSLNPESSLTSSSSNDPTTTSSSPLKE